MPCKVESASIEPKFGNKFIVGGEDMWVHLFDFFSGEEICKCLMMCGVYWLLIILTSILQSMIM